MIIQLKKGIESSDLEKMARYYQAIEVKSGERTLLVTPSKMRSVDAAHEKMVEESWVFESDMQLSARSWYGGETRQISFGANVASIGGTTGNTLFIAGPCSVESEEQIFEVASVLTELGIHVLRAGAFKPRTSPYTFQGLGVDGLKLMAQVREKTGLAIISEIRDATHAADVIEYTDIIQIGAKAMYDHGILRAAGSCNKPVLIKRGFGTTLQEFVQAAEFVLAGGNDRVMLCERGIRTFETKTRFTLDLCGVSYLKEYTNLPIFVDPSHAMGYAYGVPDLTRAAVAMGVDGLLIEAHPTPEKALSDAAQQLSLDGLRKLHGSLSAVASAVGRRIV